jgi:crotonobetainyl-CoA:carnitine CoA-transferase CaiB-like acyl-CoA transferase
MIEAALNAAAEQVVECSAGGALPERDGNRGPMAAPQNVYACAGDEEWIAIAIATDEQWLALRDFLGDAEWAADPALATEEGRRAAHDQIDEQLAAWCADQKAPELAERLVTRGVPAGYVIDARDSVFNPQMEHRGFFEVEEHPVTGSNRLPMVPFVFRNRAGGWMRRPSPMLGEHNDEVLGELLGLSSDDLASLRERGLIGDRPRGA